MADVSVVVDLKGKDSGATSAINSVQKALGGLTGVVSGPIGAIGKLTSALGTIGLAAQGIQAVAGAAQSAGQALGVGLASQTEQTRAKFAAFIKDTGQLNATLAMVRSEADKTPFSFQAMSAAVAGLIPSANQAKIPLQQLTQTAEILAASHPEQGLEGAAFALREAVSGDFTSVIERFDLPRQTINKLKAEGVPAAEIVSRAMGEMGYSMDLVGNLAKTTEGRFSTFQDAIDGIKLKVGQPILDALGEQLDRASGWLNDNAEVIGQWADSFGNYLGIAVSMAADAFGNLVQLFSGLVPVIEDLGSVAGAVLDGDWSGAMEAMQRAAGDAISFLDSNFGHVGDLLADLGRTAQRAVSGDFAGAMDSLGSVAQDAVSVLNDVLGGALTDLAGHFEAFGPTADAFAGFMGNVKDAAASAVSAGLTILSDGVQFMLDRAGGAQQILNDFAGGVDTVRESAAGAAPLVSALGGVMGELKDQVNPATAAFGNFLVQQGLVSAKTNELPGPMKAASAAIDALWAILANTPVGKVVASFQEIVGAIQSAQKATAETATRVDVAWQQFIAFTGNLVTAVSGKLNELTAYIHSLPGKFQADAVATGASIVNGIIQGLNPGRLVGAVASMVQGAIAAARANLDAHSPSRVFEEMGEGISEGAAIGVEGASDDLIGAVEDMLSEARVAAEEGNSEVIDTFATFGDAIGAQYEKTYTIVEEAENKLGTMRNDVNKKYQRDLEVEETKHERRVSDLREQLAGATVEQRKSINERLLQEEENYQRKREDLARDTGDRLIELDADNSDVLAAAQQKQALVYGGALRDFQRGVEDLERDVNEHVNAIHSKAQEARSEAIKVAEDAIDEANQKTLDAIQKLDQRRQETLDLRGRREAFGDTQDAASLVFKQGREDADLVTRQQEQLADRKKRLEESASDLSQRRAREDADAQYELERDLQDAITDEDKAKVQTRFSRAKQDLDRRRKLDDEERDRKAKADDKALQDSFAKAVADLAKRRAAEQKERDFRADQEKDRQRFEDGLADEALAKQKRRLEEERVERIKKIDQALDEKMTKINDSERKEQEALKKSSDQKLQDLKERFLDKVGPLTGDALASFERLFNGIRDRVRDAAGAVDEFAKAMARMAGAQVTASQGASFKAADGQQFSGQSADAQAAFRAQYGDDAARQWAIEHNRAIGLPDAPVRATQNVFGDTSGSLAELGLSAGGNIGAQAMALAASSGGSVTVKQPGEQPVTYGLGGSQEGIDTLLGQQEYSTPEEFRASGGPVLPGHDYIVGEEGPERVRFKAPGHVFPNGSAAGLSGGDTALLGQILNELRALARQDVVLKVNEQELGRAQRQSGRRFAAVNAGANGVGGVLP